MTAVSPPGPVRRVARALARAVLAVLWALACAGVLLAAAAGLVRVLGVERLGLDVLLVGAAPVLLGAAWPGLALAVVRRRRGWALVAGVCVVGQLLLRALPAAQGPEPVPLPSDEARVLSVLTHNVFVVNADLDALAAQLRGSGADVLALQEMSPVLLSGLEERGALDGYPHRVSSIGEPAPPGGSPAAGEGLLLASRYPLADVDVLSVGVRRWPSAVVRTPGGDVRVVVVHVVAPLGPASLAAWRSGVASVGDLADDGARPLVVAGDLNASAGNGPFAQVDDASLVDAAAVASQGTPRTWPAWPLPRLWQPDHVLVSPEVGVVATRTLPAVGSDHAAVLAELALPAPAARPRAGALPWGTQTSRPGGRGDVGPVPAVVEESPGSAGQGGR